jgi:hypothetical protein
LGVALALDGELGERSLDTVPLNDLSELWLNVSLSVLVKDSWS